MSVENENIEILVTRARRLCMAITDATTGGYLQDGDGTLQAMVHNLMAAARIVEQDLDPDEVRPDLVEDDWLEAHVENDLGEVDL